MTTFRKQINILQTLGTALALSSALSGTVQAGASFSSEQDAYEACRGAIERHTTQTGLFSFERFYGRSRDSAGESYEFWINARVHDLDSGEILPLRSRCKSQGFGLVQELETESGRWPLAAR